MSDVHCGEKEALARSRDISGWLEEEEARILYRFAEELGPLGPILEIGSYYGKSTTVIAAAARSVGSRVFAVDPHEGINYWQDKIPPMERFGPSLAAFQENLRVAGVSDAVDLLLMTSRMAFEELKDRERFSLVFIDGNHGYTNVRDDFEMWSQCLIDGGVLALHDANGKMPGPKRVFAEVKKRADFEFISLVVQLASFRKRV